MDAPPVTAPAGDIHCRILFADDVVIDRGWRERLCDPFWRLYVNHQDGAWVSGQGGVQALPAGRMVLVPAWSRLDSGCRCAVRQCYVHFDPMGLGGDWVREHCARLLVLPEDAVRERAFGRLFERIDATPPWRLRLQAVVAEALAAGLEQLPAPALARLGQRLDAADPVAPALAFIEDHLGEALGVERLAALCWLSSDHFARLFRERVGQTPARYVQERRMVLAAGRLLATGDDIGRIAQDCGFANRFHFSRVFSRTMGVPPAAYRRGR
jgi:AraC-like DNA-binding protein